MAAGVYNLTIEQGATFRRQFTLRDQSGNPMNLNGFSARMQIRPEIDDEEILVDLSTDDGGITLGGDEGTIVVYISAEDTEVMDSEGVYDLELIAPGGDVDRILKGRVRLDPEVTRP
jgi:hypothetical protein